MALQLRKLRLRILKRVAQGLTVSKWQNLDSGLVPESAYLICQLKEQKGTFRSEV